MSCNTFIPIMDLVREVEALLAANYIDKDDPRITGGVFTNPTIKEGFLLDVQAREEFCRLVQECGLDAPFGKMWLSRPLYPDSMFVSYEDSGEPQTKWKTIQAVLESAGVFGPAATSLSSRLAAEIDRSTTAESEIISRAEAADRNIAANEESIATNATAIITESRRAVAAEGVLTRAADALELKDLSLQSQVNSIGGGKKAYVTYALMVADKDNIAANSSIDVTSDTDPLKNGTYSYDGAVFTKSVYDIESIVRTKVLNTFKTKSLMEASNLPIGSYAAVMDSTGEVNGFYKKEGDVWVRTAFDPYLFSKNTSNGLFLGRPKGIQVDTIAKTITFDGRIARNKQSYVVSSKSVSYDPTDIVVKAFVYSPSTDTISIVHGETHTANLDDGFIFGTTTNFNNKPYLEGFGNYYVDGVLNSEPRYKDVSMVMNDAAAIDFRFAENKIMLDRVIWIPYDNYRINITPQTITLSPSRSKSARNLLVYDTLTFTVFNIEADLNYKIDAHQVVICGYKEDTKTIYGLDVYTVDGVSSEEFNSRNGALHLALFEDGALNFDFNTNKIALGSEMWIPMPSGRVKVLPQTVELDPARNKATAFRDVLLVDLKTQKLVVKQGITAFNFPANHIMIGAFHERDNKLWNLDRAYINGRAVNTGGVATKEYIGFGYSTDGFVNINVADSFKDTDSLPLNSINSSIVYGWYDQLVANHPDYVSKVDMGLDATGTLPIYEYIFKPPLSTLQSGKRAEIPRILIQALHNEQMNFVYPYIMMREICNNWRNSDALESLRFGCEIRVIPVLNPYGLNNATRANGRGVDINRNYPYGWVFNDSNPLVNSGTEALSETETQISYNEMMAFKPHIFVDCHTFGGYAEVARSLWLTSLNPAAREICNNTAITTYANYAKKYTWFPSYTDLVRLLDLTLRQGTAADAADALGILGGTVETAWDIKGDAEAEIKGNTIAVNLSVDFLTAFVRQSIGVLLRRGKL